MEKIGVYPIEDDAWIDIGQWSNYKKVFDKINEYKGCNSRIRIYR